MHKINPSRDGKHYIVIGPYNPALVESIKKRIPPSGREWSKVGKFWKVKRRYREELERLVEESNAA